MRLLIVRHGDPDYTIDSLTEKGWREAELLADRMSKETIDYFYVSPLGRARDTASCTLKKNGRTAEVCPWLREFEAPIWRPDVKDHRKIPWDWMPADWTGDDRAYRRDQWFEMEPLAEGNVKQEYDRVTGEFDRLLERHGYRRQGGYYQAVCPNRDTLALFCHFGVECGAAEPPDGRLTHGALAWPLCPAYRGDYSRDGGEAAGDRQLPDHRFRGSVPSLRGGGSAFLCSQIL